MNRQSSRPNGRHRQLLIGELRLQVALPVRIAHLSIMNGQWRRNLRVTWEKA